MTAGCSECNKATCDHTMVHIQFKTTIVSRAVPE
jgi:hypothetical protein